MSILQLQNKHYTFLLISHVSFMWPAFLNMQTTEKPNMRQKYAEMWYRIAWNQLPHVVPQGSGHMDGAILLAVRW